MTGHRRRGMPRCSKIITEPNSKEMAVNDLNLMNAVFYEKESADVCLNCTRDGCNGCACDAVNAVEKKLTAERGGKKSGKKR